MLKHVSTRWLSLESAVSRIAGLKSYFLSNDDNNARFRRLQEKFEDPLTEVHLLFFQAVLQQFVQVNKFMQWENPLLPIMFDVLHDFLRKLCCRFLDVKKIKEVGAKLVDYEDDQVKKADAQLDIGFMTKVLLAKLTDEGHDLHMIKKFL